MEVRIKIPFPDDPAKRAMVVAIVASILIHLALLASLIGIDMTTPSYIKRGEPLLVDLAPDKPEEKAPLGNPSRPVGPVPEAPRKAPAVHLPTSWSAGARAAPGSARRSPRCRPGRSCPGSAHR